MARIGLVLFGLVVLASSVSAQGVDKAKLREAAVLPSLPLAVAVEWNAENRDARGKRIDQPMRLEVLKKQLKGTEEDALVLLEISLLQKQREEWRERRETLQQIEQLLRPVTQSKSATQAHLVCLYADVASKLGLIDSDACLKWAQHAARVAPDDWRCWTYLGEVRSQQTLEAFFRYRTTPPGGLQSMLADLVKSPPTAKAIMTAEECLNEAKACYDHARKLAPQVAERQEKRFSFRTFETLLRNTLCELRNQPIVAPRLMYDPALLDELKAMAELVPDHVGWQAQTAHALIFAVLKQQKTKDGAPAPLTAEEKARVKPYLDRLQKGAASSDADSAAHCRCVLMALHQLMGDTENVVRYAAQTLQVDPKNDSAWDGWEMVLLEQKRDQEAGEVAKARAERAPSARSHYLWARHLAERKDWAATEEALRAGLKLDPENVHCMLGLAATLMKAGDRPEAMAQAGDLVRRAKVYLRPEMPASLHQECELLSAIQQALSGQTAIARLVLQGLHAADARNARVGAALAAVGR
jgi:tetratricopeptide (TPR) repeat protein